MHKELPKLTPEEIRDAFANLYEMSKVWQRTYWQRVPVQKCPLDLFIYQEIIYECHPDLIIETGTAEGGSALFMASICDLVGRGHILSIDTQARSRRQHPRITYITGSSSSIPVVATASDAIQGKDVMVVLDSDHTKAHVLDELGIYSFMVTKGQYLIVEDTNINGHPIRPGWGEGPWEALQEFLPQHPEFIPDVTREKFGLTFQPGGYLRRV